MLSIVLLLKGITNNDLSKEEKIEQTSKSFDTLSKVRVNQGINNKLLTSFALSSYEDTSTNLSTFDKLIQRVLTLKLEDTIS
jgi:hypothetical protein